MVRSGGVDLAWCVYDAQYFGTAQRRRRLFLVADFRGRSASEILFVPKSLRRYFETGGTPRQGLTAFAESGAGAAGAGELIPATMRIRCGCEGGGKGPLVQVEKSGTLATRNDQYLFVPRTMEILNDQGGSSMTVERSGLSPTLRSQTHGNLPIVAAGFDLQQITSKTNRSSMKPVQPTLCKAGRPHVVTGTLCMATTQANSEIMADAAPTLTCDHDRPIVASAGFRYKAGSAAGGIGYQDETAPTMLAGQQSAVLCAGYVDLIARRLMPIEAERLMGFKDFWTECGCNGEKISDTARFQMLGNSIAVPCAAYIMQGISQVMETGA